MTLKCVIIDDEPLALELMESYVRKTPFLELCGKYNNAVMALNDINFRNIDLLFLDIPDARPQRLGTVPDASPRHPYRLYHGFQSVCIGRFQSQCFGLPAQAYQLQ